MNEILEKCHEALIEYKSLLEEQGDGSEAELVYDLIYMVENELEV